MGSQQRSDFAFRYASELVRNGRIGKVHRDLSSACRPIPRAIRKPEMPVPQNFNYEAWLGSTPMVYYTEKRVHPQRRQPEGSLRPAGLAALRAVRRRHDHRLGRASHRYRALGDGPGALGSGATPRRAPSFPRAACGTCTAAITSPCVTPTAPPCTSATSIPTVCVSSARERLDLGDARALHAAGRRGRDTQRDAELQRSAHSQGRA